MKARVFPPKSVRAARVVPAASVRAARVVPAASVRAARVGHGGNCSSVGSVVDTLFLGAVAGGAVFAALAAALASEPIKVVGEDEEPAPEDEAP